MTEFASFEKRTNLALLGIAKEVLLREWAFWVFRLERNILVSGKKTEGWEGIMCLSKPNQTKHVGQWKRGKHSRHGVLQLLWGARLKNMLGTGKKAKRMGMGYISPKMGEYRWASLWVAFDTLCNDLYPRCSLFGKHIFQHTLLFALEETNATDLLSKTKLLESRHILLW